MYNRISNFKNCQTFRGSVEYKIESSRINVKFYSSGTYQIILFKVDGYIRGKFRDENCNLFFIFLSKIQVV